MTATRKTRAMGRKAEREAQQARLASGQDPDEETIRQRCAEIRKNWDKDRLNLHESWSIPVIHDDCLIEKM